MDSLQVWLPFFGRSLGFADATRDMRRALEEWAFDHRIWVLPSLKKPIIRWQEKWLDASVQMCAVPGEMLECIDVHHVGENGHVYGIPQAERFPNSRVDGMLDTWLTWARSGDFHWDSPSRITIDVPEVIGKEVRYRQREFEAPSLPVQKSGILLRHRTRTDGRVVTDADAAEAHRNRYGDLRRIKGKKGQPIIIGSADPHFRAVPGVLRPPELLQGLFPIGITLDAITACLEMASVMQQSTGDPHAALARAFTKAGPYISNGMSTLALTWFMPTFVELRDMKQVIQRGASLKLVDVREFGQLNQSEAWRKLMTRPVPVTRAWGPIGLFWALLIQRLKSEGLVLSCERCGKILKGTRAKRFCNESENPECFRKRRATDRRRARASGSRQPAPNP